MQKIDPEKSIGVLSNTRYGANDTHAENYYSQFLFDTLRTAVLYLDKWGRIRSANVMARQLFGGQYLIGKTALEVFGNWDNPVMCYQEILSVARTGNSVTSQTERIFIDNEERWFQTDKLAVANASHGFNGVVYTLDDITQLTHQQHDLEKSEANYRAFIDNSNDAIWRIDIHPPIQTHHRPELMATLIKQSAVMGDCNHLFYDVYGVSDPKGFHGVPLSEIDFNSKIIDIDSFVANDQRISDCDAKFYDNNGEERYLKISAQGIIANNLLVGIWGVSRDVTERQRHIDRLEYQAMHDSLTGLPNRTRMQMLVEKAILDCQDGKQFALMIIDLDSFKEINDTLGHDMGDHIIQEIGPRIHKQLTGIPSAIARLGGDEFAILLTDIEDPKYAEFVGENILQCIRKYFRIDHIDVEIRASLGIAFYPSQATDFSTLLRYSDVAMYCAKGDMIGLSVYDPDKDPHSPKRLSLMSELGKAIRNDELVLHYQPKICLQDKKVVGVEALARWTHPVMGFISPTEFVPIAEMTDLINELTSWVLDSSLKQVRQWRDHSLDMTVAVNVSARNLLQENFCEYIECLLARYDLPASCLGLEITETSLMKNTEKTVSVLQKLNELGIEISIDDFGTGYSSLAYLKSLPVKWLKIDYSFVINMLQSEHDRIIVTSTINMAHSLGLSVVAEGVETGELLTDLTGMNCEQAQGFHIARPMPATDIEQWCINYRMS